MLNMNYYSLFLISVIFKTFSLDEISLLDFIVYIENSGY